MTTVPFDINKIKSLNICIVVPTYNNQNTLQRVLDSLLPFTSNIIIVNDGSTDATLEILKNYSQLTQIHHPINEGKGMALRNGFKKALELKYRYAITIDSDGQHFASDLPTFIEAIEDEPNTLLIGSRNMKHDNVPQKSSFGNKFSNFWFWVETGVRAEDTQTGYRLYPVKLLRDLNFYTHKYEFEIEVLVRASWKGIAIESVPVKVYYSPKETRISHFRPFKDFSRISSDIPCSEPIHIRSGTCCCSNPCCKPAALREGADISATTNGLCNKFVVG